MNSLADGLPLLTLLIAVPTVGAALVALFGQNARGARIIAMVASGLTALLALILVLGFDKSTGDFQFVSQHEWLPALGINYKLGVDGISVFLVALSALLFPLALLGSKITENVRGFYAWMLVLQAGCIGSFLALDLFLFFVFFEVVLVPMYFLIGGWGYARRSYAALKFFLYTLAGSAFLLVGILAVAIISAQNANVPVTFDFVQLAAQKAFSETEAKWLFAAFAIAFAVKVPVFPVHTWLPDTYTQAPIAGVVVSAGVMVKLGTYGLVRFCVELFPEAARDLGPIFLTLAVIGMIYGAVIAAIQKDFKRLVAYSSLSHLGFIVLGTFAFSETGLTGAVMQMINHGISTGALFLMLGFIYARRRTTMLAELKGIQKAAPVLAGVMTVVVMSNIGVPGLNGFVGEFLILLGTFVTHRWWAVVGTITVVLAAFYLLYAYQRTFHGEPDAENAAVADMTTRERLVMAPLVALIVLLGVFPKPMLDRIEPSVDRALNNVNTPAQTANVAAAPASEGNR